MEGTLGRTKSIRGLATTPGGRRVRPPEAAALSSATWREPSGSPWDAWRVLFLNQRLRLEENAQAPQGPVLLRL